MNMNAMRGLGRGLGSLIPTRPSASIESSAPERSTVPSGQILFVPVGRISPNPFQPRESIPHQGTEELVASIRQHGILQPLVVSPKGDGYELIAGERRFRAAQVLGLTTVPVLVRTASDQDKLVLALIENIQRENLNPLEEARAYQKLADQFDLSQDEIAVHAGKSRSVVANTMRLLSLPPQIQQAVRDGQIPTTAARTLGGLKSSEEQLAWFAKITNEKLSVRDIESKLAHARPRATVRRGVEDPETRAAEEELEQALGTKVRIKKTGAAGRIEIEFFSAEEFTALCRRIVRGSPL